MFRVRSNSEADGRSRPLMRIRYADEWVGILVMATFGLFVFAIVEAGVLRDWLTPSGKLHFNLPESGIAGLAVGNDIELMGIRIGSIRSVKINPHGNMYAIADIDLSSSPISARTVTQSSAAASLWLEPAISNWSAAKGLRWTGSSLNSRLPLSPIQRHDHQDDR